ncbi:Metallopeptidase family M24 [Carpediemonas membranifera]|uniref:Metallopeptidase family M24 n=1 Tax=Carpediemonas membranifera TaxID=201153 RepID=A0A8J6AQ31_9EUKA|nr:Metallopeptidase family M24 [Carpediemonas membranifera]|eukprot:KAG9390886.1 Metallopeptidase family M24 [Carpediemonas membranifera]
MQGLDKYQAGGKILDQVLGALVASVVPGTNIGLICKQADDMLMDLLSKVYAKGKTKCEKGIAYPTCISKNNCVGHYSPDEAANELVEDGDVLKLDCAVQIDGYVSHGAVTVIARDQEEPLTGPIADAVSAAHYCGEAIVRMLRPGTKNHEITEVVGKICDAYGVKPVDGVLSHEMKRFVMLGGNTWANRAHADERIEECELEAEQVYNVDILISTGEGVPKVDPGIEASVFLRNMEETKDMRVKSARQVLGEIDRRFPTFMFGPRLLEHEQSKFGLKQLEREGMVYPFPPMFCKPEETVVQVRFTAVITGSNTVRVNNGYTPYVFSEKAIEDQDVLNILKRSTKRKAKK